MCGAGYAFTPKPDAIVIQFLSFVVGMISLAALFYLHRNRFREGLILQSDRNANKVVAATGHELPVGTDGYFLKIL